MTFWKGMGIFFFFSNMACGVVLGLFDNYQQAVWHLMIALMIRGELE